MTLGKGRDLSFKKNLDRLKGGKELYYSFIRNFHGIAFYGDMHFSPLLFDGAVRKITGYSKREFFEKRLTWDQIIHPEDRPRIYQEAQKIKTVPHYSAEREYRIIQKTGKICWVREFLRNICNETGTPILVSGVMYDITRRKSVEEERERLLKQLEGEKRWAEQLVVEAEERAGELDAVFSALSDTLVVYDKEGTAVSANPATIKLFGFNPVGMNLQLLSQKLTTRHRHGDPIKVDDLPAVQALRGKTVSSKYFFLKNAAGEEIMALGSASPIFRRGKVVGSVATLHDVSESWQAEKRKDDFVAISGHELKTPITTLKAYLQILQSRFAKIDDEEANRYLLKMSTQIDRLTNLVKDLLDVTKVGAGKLELNKEFFDFDSLVDEAIEDFQRIAPSFKFIKRGRIGKKVFADKDRLSQVLANLLSNAVRYSLKPDRVIITLSQNKGSLGVSVKDFGVGISEENRGKIFERFFRVGGALGKKFSGLGLGLYISSEIIKKHNGEMEVKSREGQGSTFSFRIPIIKKEKNNEKK